ncbi:hypothetical protein [Paraburkholderia sp. DGU8]|uniref:hypothetical protein n=1 Tax=Paraburkholderia sp. DGU8 TaxID=3161997 RepID=UPI003466B8AA
MRGLFSLSWVVLCATVFTVAGCTLIHIEGNSNSVTETGGHTGTLKVPTLSSEVTPTQ